jgi:predicted XRE-type DNA-binding protein
MNAAEPEPYANVWEALEETPEAVVNMTLRSELLIALQETIGSWKLTQVEAARRLGVRQPRLNDLLRGRVSKFSLDALVNLASRAGLQVHVEIAKAA